MIKSKFNIVISLSIAAIAIAGPLLLTFCYFNMSDMEMAFKYFALPFVTIAILLTIIIELPKIKRLTINDKSISITSPITGRTKQFEYIEIDSL